ncbi:hypothetical protein BUALT_Bualt17G0014800 [Buddleja alternifolia]|uniref:Pectinesterase n=1 Tax=Buddleja alternifolia TaxID=168488 RepID=A0AAV6WFT2_9LAMI|nr:hypothetical protein BUALT_Bualt17G0014800 [Buddleja alternifolia]
MASPNFLCSMLKSIFSLMIIGITFGVSNSIQDKPFKTSLKTLCEMSLYPITCYHSLTPLIDSKHDSFDSLVLYKLSIQTSITEVSRVYKDFFENGISTQKLEDLKDIRSLISPIESCHVLFSLALHNLNWSLPTLITTVKILETRGDYKTWLSATIANLQTCIDGFEYAPDGVRKIVTENLENSTKLVSNSLSIISKIDEYYTGSQDEPDRNITSDRDPAWLSFEDKKILYDSKTMVKPDVVVAADGSGKYKTIREALNVVPLNSNRRFIIYVKKGIYNEIVRVEQNKWNVMMFGDGMDNTIVSGNLNVASGTSTFMSATFGALGKGFIARDMGFQNTAGAAKFQAVALLSASDQSVFYRCKMDAYQDILCTYSNRQFYRECKIYGTVDFIFGFASVVIQSSSILVKRPLPGQKNTITAQGKSVANSISGISIQNCNILAAENLVGVRTFLGRPWKDFSTTIFMENQLGSLIDPQGWLPWIDNVTPPGTIYYAEYNNKGPGAITTNRVQWKGVRVNINPGEASKFTVKSFISGAQWLPATGVPFQQGL